MAFETETLTVVGAQFLASATAQNRLVIDGCNAYTSFYSVQQAQAVTAPPLNEFSSTDDATLIGATDNHVQIRAAFHAGESTGGDANTVMVYGHLESDPLTLRVIYVASSNETFHIPLTTDVASVCGFLFDITYNADPDAVTTATQSTYTSLAEFLTLKERTVTTHKEGDPNTGDDQEILGHKTFSGDVTIRHGDKLYLSNIENNSGYIKISSKNSSNIAEIELMGSNPPEIILNAGNDGSVSAVNNTTIGRSDRPWSNVYASRLTAPITDDEWTEQSTNTLIVAGNTKENNSGSLVVKSYYHYDGAMGSYGFPDEATITITNALKLNGTTKDIYLKLYTDTSSSKLSILSDNNSASASFIVGVYTQFDENVRATGNLNVDGTLSVSEEVYIHGYFEVTGNSLFDGNCTVEGDLTVNGLIQGLTPMASQKIQVGAIVLVFIKPAQSLTHYTAGQTLDNSDLGVLSMYFAKTGGSGSFITSASNLRQVTIDNTMRFILMNDINQSVESVALVQRIA